MSDKPVRRFPFWLTLSVLGNLVLLGLLAGIFLKAPKPVHKPHGDRHPHIELTEAEREGVRDLMRESFEAARPVMEARREAERALAEALKADPYNEEAARAALARLREADRAAREAMGDHMFDRLATLSPDQREVIAAIIAGNMEKRGKRHKKLREFKERREEMREQHEGEMPPPPPPE